MTTADLDEYFSRDWTRACKLECRRRYAVGGAEAERIAAWHSGAPRPERSVRTNEYLRELATDVLVRKRGRERTVVVDHPLDDYGHYRLEGLIESQAAGEEISVVVRSGGSPRAVADLDQVRHDAWLFAGGGEGLSALLMHYDDNDAFIGATAAGDVDLALILTERDVALRHAVPLNSYLAALRRAQAAA